MPTFKIRLEDPNSEHFRETNIQAPDEQTARRWVQRRELDLADFQIDDEDRIAEMEAKEADTKAEGAHPRLGTLAQVERAHLMAHRQSDPYEIVEVTVIDEGDGEG